MHFSTRAYRRILKLALTIADLDSSGTSKTPTWPKRSNTSYME